MAFIRRGLSWEDLKIPISKTRLKIPFLESHPDLPGANELIGVLLALDKVDATQWSDPEEYWESIKWIHKEYLHNHSKMIYTVVYIVRDVRYMHHWVRKWQHGNKRTSMRNWRHLAGWRPSGSCFNIRVIFWVIEILIIKVRPFLKSVYLYNGNIFTGMTIFLYWDGHHMPF